MAFGNEKASAEAGITPIRFGEEGYPEGWKGLSEPPPVLYAKGDLSLLKERRFAVVGSRRTTEGARKLGRSIAEALCGHFAVVTGAADGGDEAALGGALKGGKAIVLIAGGFGALPKENPLLAETEKTGLLLSACPYDTQVRAYSYELRNKLLAAMCEGVLVLGAAKKSGALITAKYAKEAGKPVFALPYAPGVLAGEGCNGLLKAGGYLTETAEDILRHYGLTAAKKPRVPLTEAEQRILTLLAEREEAHANELAASLGVPVFKLLTTLSAMEVKGVVVKLGGNRFAAV